MHGDNKAVSSKTELIKTFLQVCIEPFKSNVSEPAGSHNLLHAFEFLEHAFRRSSHLFN